MKKIISCVLLLSLALTIVVSAMPSRQVISTSLVDKQMTQIFGGRSLSDIKDGGGASGGSWKCAGVLFGTGIVFIGEAAMGPVGWGAFFVTVGGGIAAISSGCGG